MADFNDLSPDRVLDAVETALDRPLSGLAQEHTSYINRVYELQARDGERLIAKFYRPGRWSPAALAEEHRAVLACARDEIPVIAPLELPDGGTLGQADGIHFALYPKRWGRAFEPLADEDWLRLGRLVGRLHLTLARQHPRRRPRLTPADATRRDLERLLPAVTASHRHEFQALGDELLAALAPAFAHADLLPVHGDLRQANLLTAGDDELMLIDFDDLAIGPAAQDLWLLLPGPLRESRHEFALICEGYDELRPLPPGTRRLIEPLRLMRLLYFLSWCAFQRHDARFSHHFPDWDTPRFWDRQLGDLRRQLAEVHQGDQPEYPDYL